jgi:uncharacterized protein (DUF1330 family)
MAAYVIAEIDVHDQAAYRAYMDAAPATIARHGGRYIARGGAAEALEGAAPKRMVILEFPTAAAARGWFNSPEYLAATKLRQQASSGRFLLVDGL